MSDNDKLEKDTVKLVEELRNLKLVNRDEYNKRVNSLKKNDSETYYKIIILLNLDEDEYSKQLKKQQIILNPSKDEKNVPPKPVINTPLKIKKKVVKKSKGSNLIITIVSVSVISILLLSIIGFFLLSNPPESDTSRNSLRLGYSIFNDLENVYLNYTFSYNNSDSYFVGNQYCKLNSPKITCVVDVNNDIIIARQENNFLYYDIVNSYSKNSVLDLQADNFLVISLYNEIFNLANDFHTIESGRESIWDLEDACAPLFFEINLDNEIFDNYNYLRYEMCLTNDGVPFAIAKESIFSDNSYEIIIAYLDSTADMSDSIFLNHDLSYWEEFLIDDF